MTPVTAGAAAAPKLGGGGAAEAKEAEPKPVPAGGLSFFAVLVTRGADIFESTARTTALSSAGSLSSEGAVSLRPPGGDLGFLDAAGSKFSAGFEFEIPPTAGESNANLLMGENAARDAGGDSPTPVTRCCCCCEGFAGGVDGFGLFFARLFSFASPARIFAKTSSSRLVCESIISRRLRSSRTASSRSAGATASVTPRPTPAPASGTGTAPAADFKLPLAAPRIPPKPDPRLKRLTPAAADP